MEVAVAVLVRDLGKHGLAVNRQAHNLETLMVFGRTLER